MHIINYYNLKQLIRKKQEEGANERYIARLQGLYVLTTN
jgi:hypothetical protein